MAIRQEGNTYYGLSTDTKPTGAVLNGREFREMDTGKKYLFDAENGEWLEQPEEGGGGGGGGTPDMKILTTDYSGMWGQATYTVLSGTYAALKSKCQSREASMVELFVETEEDPSQGTIGQKACFAAVEVALLSSGGTEFIQLGFAEPDGGTFGLSAYPDNTVDGVWPFGD